MIDTHCHIMDPPLDADFASHCNDARDAGVSGLFCVSTTFQKWKPLLEHKVEIIEILPESRFFLGFHPWFLTDETLSQCSELEKLMDDIDGLGEIGLDRTDRGSNFDLQVEIMETELSIAARFNKPCLVHVVKSHDVMLGLVRKYPSVRGVIHSFSGSREEAVKYTDSGWKLGAGFGITRPTAQKLHKLMAFMGSEHFVIETDSPWVKPWGYEEAASYPKMLATLVAPMAEIFQLSPQDFMEKTAENARMIF